MINKDIIKVVQNNRLSYKNFDSLISFISNKLDENIKEVKSRFYKMLDCGDLFEVKKGKLIAIPSAPYYKGKIIGNARGFGFCEVSGKDNDYFISESALNTAMDGDEVIIKALTDNADNQDAVVVKIIRRANEYIVGDVYSSKSGLFISPDNNKINKKIKIIKGKEKGARVDEKVVCKISFDFSKNYLKAEVVEVIGHKDEVKSLELGIIRAHGLYETFPQEVLNEADALPDKVSEKDKKGRVDKTNEEIFTIDGFDAKDFDDAVNIKKLPNGGYKLGVHIADVTHYVKEGGEIDEEAFLRGTSVYFPLSVLPMLPEKLSNGICSLKEGVERLTLSVDIEFDENGKALSHKIYEGVIKSVKRLTYKEVFAALSGEKVTDEIKALLPQFKLMAELSAKLEKLRVKRGALDLDIPEPQFTFDENGYVNGVERRDRNEAHKLIESFMIAANEAVAEEYFKAEIPFVYRIHEKPTVLKVKDVCSFIEGLGLSVPDVPSIIDSQFIEQLLSLVKDKPYRASANKIILRSLQKAKYSNECIGHFGLASVYYCHFTSPIRRYPDLSIHRIIKQNLHGKLNAKKISELEEQTFEIGEQSSFRERVSDVAEREVDDLWKAYLMKDKVGEEFEGIISSVTNFGLFIELNNTVEGLAKIEDLPGGGYLFMEKSLKLKNETHTYSIGDTVKVEILNVDLDSRRIDFQLI